MLSGEEMTEPEIGGVPARLKTTLSVVSGWSVGLVNNSLYFKAPFEMTGYPETKETVELAGRCW